MYKNKYIYPRDIGAVGPRAKPLLVKIKRRVFCQEKDLSVEPSFAFRITQAGMVLKMWNQIDGDSVTVLWNQIQVQVFGDYSRVRIW